MNVLLNGVASLAVAALVLAPSSSAAQSLQPVATVEGITEYRLDNGLRVLLFPDPSKSTTTVAVTYFVGSRHEAYGETGMAHLLEHLVFKGTPDHPDIPKELTDRGALPNGTTWLDRTNYFESFPATEENLEWALDLEADRMVNSFISKEDLDSEMTVVRNEMESGENRPFNILMQRTISTSYLWHNYGKSTIGARSDIENVPIERLQAFYRKYYQPDNAMLVIAGQFDPETALAIVQEKFGAIEVPVRERDMILWPTYTTEPTQDGERAVTLRRVGDVQVVMHVYHIPPGSHEDFAAVSVLSQVLGDTPSGRLYERLVEPGLAASASSFAWQFREAGPFFAFAQVREDASLEAAASELDATIADLLTEPITQEEVGRAKTSLLKNIELSMNNTERIALGLSEWAAMGDWRLFFLNRDRIGEVTTEDVQRVAYAYLKPSNRTVGRFIPTESPDRAEIPAAPDVAALVADYAGGEAVAEGEAFDASYENIDARTATASLPGGLKVAFLAKENRGDAVTVSLTFPLGSEGTLQGRSTDGSFAAAMLMRGTVHRTREEIQDEFDRLRASVRISGSATQVVARVETVRESLPDVLRLVGEVLREPSFDSTEFEVLKEQRLAQLESQLSEPQAKAFNAFQRLMNAREPGHPDYTPTLEEQQELLEGATLEGAREFHTRFYGSASGRAVLVGDFDRAAASTVLSEMFDGWTAEEPWVRVAGDDYVAPPENLEIETPDKANAFFVAGLELPVRDDHEDYPALVMANFMLGGGFLNSRLATRIRQEDGLSYGVGSQFQASSEDEEAMLFAFAIYAPENVDELEAAFLEEIGKVLDTGFTAEELEAAKEGYTQFQLNLRTRDQVLVGSLGQNLYLGRTMAFDGEIEERIQALTPEQILGAFRRHIDPEAFVIVKAGDFQKGRAVS